MIRLKVPTVPLQDCPGKLWRVRFDLLQSKVNGSQPEHTRVVGFPTSLSITRLQIGVCEAVSAKDIPACALPRCYSADSFSDISKLTDEELMQFLSSGRHDALAVLFDRYHHLVFSIALRIVRDPGEAEEVVQAVFFDIFRTAANFDTRKGILKGWLLQFAYHGALHRKRHLVANHFYHWEELEAVIESGAGLPLASELPEVVRLAEEMLGKLKPRQRAVLELTYYEGLTAEEIADRLGESVHAVRHDLYRGLAALRTAFGNGHEKQ